VAGKHITIRIPAQLREDIKEYAARKGITVSQLTLEYYRRLLEDETKQEADQI
jgi:predicted DNA binding CopG/RHH family protein